jgi:hypothetical protein
VAVGERLSGADPGPLAPPPPLLPQALNQRVAKAYVGHQAEGVERGRLVMDGSVDVVWSEVLYERCSRDPGWERGVEAEGL